MSRLEIATAVYLQQSRTAFFSELIVRRLSMRHSVANEALSLAFVVHFLGRIIHKQPVQTHKVTSVRLTSSPSRFRGANTQDGMEAVEEGRCDSQHTCFDAWVAIFDRINRETPIW